MTEESEIPRLSEPRTVTFVFSDLEGSTRLLATLRDGYGQVLEAYHDLIGSVFARHGGTEIDKAGDGLFYSFPSAHAATSAAVEAQLAMGRHDWPGGVSVRARMGVHTGEAVSRPSGYVGMDVHRAARIAAAGHGSQILLSGVTRDLAATDLPAEMTLTDLGEHWLKDLAQPEHLYQLTVAGLPQAFPPLKSLVTLPNNLPRHLNSFIGRRSDVAAVRQLTTEAPLVTLTGPGGVGKTRLGLQVAAELLDTFGDGAYLVELETLTDENLVVQQVAVDLGIAIPADADAQESVLGHLRTRQLLLILDNCEHVIGACARLANALLRSCPGLRILATSREALGVPGERLYPVRSLTLPVATKAVTAVLATEFEAVDLFCERARAADPGFEITDANAAAVVEICERLDGIPLAIELAAARVRALSPKQIAERLDDRFRLLTGGSRTVMPRHQTLRAAIDWSFDLLPETEQSVLWRLSSFSGGFSLDAAEAVCAGRGVAADDVVDHLARLVEKSLVNRQGDKYRLLETMRGYARERSLEAGEAAGAYERHRDWYLDLVRRAAPAFFRGAESAAWLDELEAEHDNLRTALSWSLNESGGEVMALELASGLWRFWEIRGYLREGRQWLERVLAATTADTSVLRADVLTAAGILAAAQADHSAAVRYHEESLALQERLGSKQGVQFALNNLANAAQHEGDAARARNLYERAIAVAGDEDPNRGFVYVSLADVTDSMGDRAAASDYYEKALQILAQTGDIWRMAYAQAAYGQSAARHGDHAIARDRYEQALATYRQLGDQRAEARLLTLLADVEAEEGRAQDALRLLYESLAIRCRLGDSPGICTALERFAAGAMDLDAARAARILAAAASLRDRTGARLSRVGQAALDQQLAQLERSLGADFPAVWQSGSGAGIDEALREAAALVER